MLQRFRVREISTTHIDKIVEANSPEESEQIAFCITGDTNQYQNNRDGEFIETEQVSDTEELTEITDDDRQWLRKFHEHQCEVARGGA